MLGNKFSEMHQQYLLTATSTLNYMPSSELQQLFNDDEKLDEKIDETVSETYPLFIFQLI